MSVAFSEPPSLTDSDNQEFPYRAVSMPAVASVMVLVLAIPGIKFPAMLAFAALAIVLGLIGWRAISQYPEEFTGRAAAMVGVFGGLAVLVGGIAFHAYQYATEVPEGYVRLPFYELQQPDGGPDMPTNVATNADGTDVFIKGYVHPTSGSGTLRRFILVPDLGTCCFGGQPKSTDMVDVTLTGGKTIQSNVFKKRLAGRFQVLPYGQSLPGFDNGIFYRFKVDQVR